MDRHHRRTWEQDEPTDADLAAIEREWPLIDAEMAVVDAEARILTALGGPTVLDWRRLRRAEARVIREAAAFLALSGNDAGSEDGPVAA